MLHLQVDEQFTAQYEAKITPLAIAIFLKYSGGELLILLTKLTRIKIYVEILMQCAK